MLNSDRLLCQHNCLYINYRLHKIFRFAGHYVKRWFNGVETVEFVCYKRVSIKTPGFDDAQQTFGANPTAGAEIADEGFVRAKGA